MPLKTTPLNTSSSTAGPKSTTTRIIAGTATPGLSCTQPTSPSMNGCWTVDLVEYPSRSRTKTLRGVTIILRRKAPIPTAMPAPIPDRSPPLGRENPRGAREYPIFLPKLRIQVTASQNTPITIPATAASNKTTESNVSCGSAIRAAEVDVLRGPSAGDVPQEPFLYGSR